MFYCGSNGQVKKTIIFLTLLMFSALLQAESSGNTNTDASGSAIKAETVLKSAAADQPRDFKFPEWPERQRLQANRQRVPPPPPGPYMSSALSDSTINGPSFGRNSGMYELNKPVFKLDSSSIPMDTFSPDRPWPRHSNTKHKHSSDCTPDCSPSRWMPENGYQYVKPRVKKKPYPVMQNRMPDRRMPDRRMNGSGSRFPSIVGTPNRQYPSPPNYAPRYTGPVN